MKKKTATSKKYYPLEIKRRICFFSWLKGGCLMEGVKEKLCLLEDMSPKPPPYIVHNKIIEKIEITIYDTAIISGR